MDGMITKQLRTFACELNESLAQGCLIVGKVYRHPKTKQFVRITSGCFLDPVYGRVSNFWYWDVLDASCKPTGEQSHGYGWTAKLVEVSG